MRLIKKKIYWELRINGKKDKLWNEGVSEQQLYVFT